MLYKENHFVNLDIIYRTTKMKSGDFLAVVLYHLGILSFVSMCQIKVADIQVKQNFVFENFTNSAWKTIKYNNFTPIEGITIYSTSDQESQFGLKGDQPVVYNGEYSCQVNINLHIDVGVFLFNDLRMLTSPFPIMMSIDSLKIEFSFSLKKNMTNDKNLID